MGAQLAAPVATGVGHAAALSLSHGQAGESPKMQWKSGHFDTRPTPLYFLIKRQVPGGLPLNRR